MTISTTEELLSVVYVSTATTSFSDADLATLLLGSRLRNAERDLTGMLLHRDGRFMQALEGPAGAVRDTYDAIKADPRHTDLRTIEVERLQQRRFPSWSMGYRAVEAEEGDEWFGSPEALAPVADADGAARLLEAFRGR